MSAHLTHEELTDHLLGISSLTVNAHLLNCQTCANELVQMKNAISGFPTVDHNYLATMVAEPGLKPGAM